MEVTRAYRWCIAGDGWRGGTAERAKGRRRRWRRRGGGCMRWDAAL
jgi:hypothetical protein